MASTCSSAKGQDPLNAEPFSTKFEFRILTEECLYLSTKPKIDALLVPNIRQILAVFGVPSTLGGLEARRQACSSILAR